MEEVDRMEEVEKIINKFGLPEPDEDGLYYTIIPADAKIFRGDPAIYYTQSTADNRSPGPKEETYNKETVLGSRGPSDKRSYKHRYFGFSKGNVAEYRGDKEIIYEFNVNNNLKLLRMDNADTKNKLKETITDAELKKIIDNNFGGNENKRNSKDIKDSKLVDYLCDNTNYDGYMIGTDTVSGDTGNKFHPEIALCRKAFDKIDYVDRHIESDDENSSGHTENPSNNNSEKHSVASNSPDHTKNTFSKVAKSLFDSDDEESDVASNLFGRVGGKKTKKTKKTKKKKNTKKTKKTKKTRKQKKN